MSMISIQQTSKSDLDQILHVEKQAFDLDEIVDLTRDLLVDPTSQPTISLLAFEDDLPVGHILFSKATLEPSIDLSMSILGPLAVIPEKQKQGIGGKLIEQGIELSIEQGFDLVFVLGHPEYYPRFNFKPAIPLGFHPTYEVPKHQSDAWMVRQLSDKRIEGIQGRVICAKTFDDPKHWRE